jgi:hypothetical protein
MPSVNSYDSESEALAPATPVSNEDTELDATNVVRAKQCRVLLASWFYGGPCSHRFLLLFLLTRTMKRGTMQYDGALYDYHL